MKRRQRAVGMTLLELLVALAIMSLSIAVLYRALAGSVQGTTRTSDAQTAAHIADSLLEKYSVVEPSGVTEQGSDGRFSWHVHSYPYSNANSQVAPQVKLHELHIAIDMPNGKVWNLETLRLQRPFQVGEVLQ